MACEELWVILKEDRVCRVRGLESEAGVRYGWGSGAALCLCEEFDLHPEGEGRHLEVMPWDSSCRQITLAPGRDQEQSEGD